MKVESVRRRRSVGEAACGSSPRVIPMLSKCKCDGSWLILSATAARSTTAFCAFAQWNYFLKELKGQWNGLNIGICVVVLYVKRTSAAKHRMRK